MKPPWDIPAAISLYNIDRWGTGYFTVNGKGNIQVQPTRKVEAGIDIMEVVAEAQPSAARALQPRRRPRTKSYGWRQECPPSMVLVGLRQS